MIPVNFTDLPLTPLVDETDDGEKEVFVPTIKAAFSIGQDGTLTPLPMDEQPDIAGFIFYEDDLGKGPRYDDDMVAWKPNVDVIFNAVCHPPGKRAVSACRVAVGIEGLFRKELLVRAPRVWQQDHMGEWYAAELEALGPTPMRWEYSFGGVETMSNPVGIGLGQDLTSDPEDPVYSLPRIEDPHNQIKTVNDSPDPVNFAPIPPFWDQRSQKLGTRGLRWHAFTKPKPPADYDPSFMNAAPDDQQVQELRGFETIRLENLHPEHPVFRMRLPDIRPRVFYVLDGDEARTLHDLPMRLDTVRVDMEAEQVTLLWRGYWEHDFEDLNQAIDYLHIVAEPASQPKKPAENYHPAFIEAIPPYEEALKAAKITSEDIENDYMSAIKEKIVAEQKKEGMPESDIARIESIDSPESGQNIIEEMIQEKMTELQNMVEKLKRDYEVD